jgi:outer membrane protein assembly factor BamD
MDRKTRKSVQGDYGPGGKSPSVPASQSACLSGAFVRSALRVLTWKLRLVTVRAMKRWPVRVGLLVLCLLGFPQRSPAPLIYTPGEGWRYESVGGGSWQRTTAPKQLAVAQAAFDKNDHALALKAARRTVHQWPYSDSAPQAQYLLARCYEARREDEKAFKAYQKMLVQYPKSDKYDEIVKRQFAIANRFLAGQSFLIWGYIPFLPSMDKTIKLYEQIIKNGAYSEIGPQAQMNIGLAHEKKLIKDYPQAAQAYEKAADRYHDQKIGTEALYKEGLAYNKQAKTAEYDQSIAAQAIATFTDFMTLHPEDTRVSEAQKLIESLKTEQARGSFDIAKFYERRHDWQGALIYYNEVLHKDPNSRYAEAARQRIDSLKKRTKA